MPTPRATPLAGDVQLDSIKIEPQILTYRAIDELSGSIASDIQRRSTSTKIVFLDSKHANNLDAYRTARQGVDLEIIRYGSRYDELAKSYRLFFGRVDNDRLGSLLNDVYRDQTLTDSGANFTTSELKANIGNLAASTLNPVTASLGFFADLMAMFKTDIKISGVDITPDKEAYISSLSRELKCRKYQVIHPARYFPASDGPTPNSFLLASISTLDDKRSAAEKTVLEYAFWIAPALDRIKSEQARINKRIDLRDKYIVELEGARAKETDLGKKKKIQAEITANQDLRAGDENELRSSETQIVLLSAANNYIEALRSITADVKTFLGGITSVGSDGESTLSKYLAAERFDQLSSGDYNILDVDVVAGGGNDRTRKNIIRYFTGSKIDFSGGAIVNWKLFSPNGYLLGSSNTRYYTGYVAPNKIKGEGGGLSCH
jgi:hypothetical protein